MDSMDFSEALRCLDQSSFSSACSELKEKETIPDAHADEFIQSINDMSQEPLPDGWTKEKLMEHIDRALYGQIDDTPPAIMQLVQKTVVTVQSSADSVACHSSSSPAGENTFTTKDAIVDHSLPEGEAVTGV